MWKDHHCPACHRLLYSRSRTRCGWCGAVLPQECRMDDDAVDAMKAEIKDIESRRKAAKLREEKAAEHCGGDIGIAGAAAWGG